MKTNDTRKEIRLEDMESIEDRNQNQEARHTNINQFTGKYFLITQTKVAKALGTTFQQIQKYEKAHNRIPLISLIKIGNYLKKPLSYFGVESYREDKE